MRTDSRGRISPVTVGPIYLDTAKVHYVSTITAPAARRTILTDGPIGKNARSGTTVLF